MLEVSTGTGREGSWFWRISSFLAGYQLRIREPARQGSGESLKGTGDLGTETCSGALIVPQISGPVWCFQSNSIFLLITPQNWALSPDYLPEFQIHVPTASLTSPWQTMMYLKRTLSSPLLQPAPTPVPISVNSITL